MFNYIVLGRNGSWASSPITFPTDRFTEYTDQPTAERYKDLSQQAIGELISYPTIFAIEGEEEPSRIGRITKIEKQSNQREVLIHFDVSKKSPEINNMFKDPQLIAMLNIDSFENYRTHWAIKDRDLLHVLKQKEILNDAQISNYNGDKKKTSPSAEPNDRQQIFIVHGHDNTTKLAVNEFIVEIGLRPIILHLEANNGMTIIEKIEHFADQVGYGIVLYTPCDIGTTKGCLVYERRARQNVVFEHGYLIGKIGRKKVAALVKGVIETPNDISGLVYIDYDPENKWKDKIVTELNNAGYSIKYNPQKKAHQSKDQQAP